MSLDAESPPVAPTTVAVAVKGGGGGGGGRGSRRAVRWAAEHLIPKADRLVMVHVIPSITSVLTPSGASISIDELNANVVDLYVKEMRVKAEEIFIPFKRLCKAKKIETVVLESDNPASALLTFITDSNVTSLVMGSCTSTTCCFSGKLKSYGVPSLVLKRAPEVCEIYVVSRRNLIATSSRSFSRRTTSVGSSENWLFPHKERNLLNNQYFKSGLNSSSVSDHSHLNSEKTSLGDSNYSHNLNHQNFGNAILHVRSASVTSTDSKQPEVQAEVEKLRLELSNTVALYNQTCDDLVLAQNQVRVLASKCLEETKQVNDSLKREENYKKIAAEEREKRLEAANEVEMVRHKLACEAYERQIAELKTLKESIEKQKIITQLFSNDTMYKKYSRDEIEMATDLFSDEKLIGEGGYGKVYRCTLDNTPVAIKVLQSDALEKKEEFLREYLHQKYAKQSIDNTLVAVKGFRYDALDKKEEFLREPLYQFFTKRLTDDTPVAVMVIESNALDKKEEFPREIEVLCQLRHPHIVLLLGACPEIGSLVYEYMEKGSLEDHISQKSNRQSLSWFIRFRIILEIACGLAFLHNSKPVPIIHRDLKPGNIFIDRNYVSKIGDVGLAKLVSDIVPDNITIYRDSIIAGTLYYMDPEYQRTGTVRPKSDLYAFGVIILQMLTGCHPNGILLKVENALKSGHISDILDTAIVDWPIAEAEKLAKMGLKCTNLRCRDRPDLDTEILPVLKNIADFAEASLKVQNNNIGAPSHYFCPILQEIMNDPHIASDGFSYEHRAIKVWVDRHNVSPVTKNRLQHKQLIPNHTLRSAIQEWRSHLSSSGVSNVE